MINYLSTMNIIFKAFVLMIVICMIKADDFSDEEITAFDYHSKFGIPFVETFREAEKLSHKLDTCLWGARTDITEVPYQVGLVISLFYFLTSACGGSLISNNRVLTAAHCASDGNLNALSFTVVLGSNRLFSGGLRIDTMDISIHPAWNPKKVENDLCILRIPVVGFTDKIQAIALPAPTNNAQDDQSRMFTDWIAIASGYGITIDDFSDDFNICQRLNSVKLTVISNKQCANTFGSDLIHNSNICTRGTQDRSPCRVDSGGPLVVNTNTYKVLIGVTSFGVQASCEADYPTVYTRVSYFVPWITSQ